MLRFIMVREKNIKRGVSDNLQKEPLIHRFGQNGDAVVLHTAFCGIKYLQHEQKKLIPPMEGIHLKDHWSSLPTIRSRLPFGHHCPVNFVALALLALTFWKQSQSPSSCATRSLFKNPLLQHKLNKNELLNTLHFKLLCFGGHCSPMEETTRCTWLQSWACLPEDSIFH